MLLCSPAPLTAQEPRAVEIGGFGQATLFDENTTPTQEHSCGGGGLLGVLGGVAWFPGSQALRGPVLRGFCVTLLPAS